MSVTVSIDGSDRTEYLVRLERREEHCSSGQFVETVFDRSFEVLPWKELLVTENGTLTFRGTTSQIEVARHTKRMTVRGADNIRRLREYFVDNEYTTAGEGAKHWIATIAAEAGCDVDFLEDYDPETMAGMSVGRQTAYEIIDEFCLMASWDIWCDTSGTIKVGHRLHNRSVVFGIAAGDNLVTMTRQRDSEPSRNACTVYSAFGNISIDVPQSWQIDGDDIRRMVVSNFYLNSQYEAAQLAARMVAAAGPEWDVKRCDLNDVYEEVGIGDFVTFDDGEGESGSDFVTSLTTTWDGDSGVHAMHLVLGERCPRIGVAPDTPIVDGRDVIVTTFESGVWRCKDIWADTIHWEPLNIGLEEHVMISDGSELVDEGSSYKGEWLVIDPFMPLTTAFLLTYAGIYRTDSIEPGFENWTLVVPNAYVLSVAEVSDDYSPVSYISRIRTTIAREGAMYVTVHGGEGDTIYVAHTLDRFATLNIGNYPASEVGCYTPGGVPAGEGDTDRLYFSGLWGECNYGHQVHTALPAWHRKGGYVFFGAAGSLESWNKVDWGCTVTGVTSCRASNGGPRFWHMSRVWEAYKIYDPGEVLISAWLPGGWHPFFCFGIGDPLPCGDACPKGFLPLGGHPLQYNDAMSWLKVGACHVPYRQDFYGGSGFASPSKIWFSPGLWTGDFAHNTGEFPIGPHGKVTPPWGGDMGVCNNRHGCVETYTHDPTKVFLWSGDNPAKCAISHDEGLTWTQKGSVPIYAGTFSGFPKKWGILYVGRDAIKGPTTAGDTSLIYATRDGGETWEDVTGDLWDQTQALGKRIVDPLDPEPWGTAGLVNIVPKFV